MTTLLTASLAATFGVWFVLTILYAKWSRSMVGRVGILGYVLPVWTFFAPRPAVHDLQLLHRNRLSSGHVTPWKEFVAYPTRRRWCSFIWHPEKYLRKTVFDLAMALVIESDGEDSPDVPSVAPSVHKVSNETIVSVRLSVAYLHFLNAVGSLPRPSDAVAVQFCVIRFREASNDLELQPLFVSEFHPLARARPAA